MNSMIESCPSRRPPGTDQKRFTCPVLWIVSAATVLLSWCLIACAVGPDYRAPDIGAPAEFISQDVLELLNEDKKVTFAVDWWRGFSDPVLNRLVADGLKNNFDITAAAERIKEARAQLALAGAGDNLVVDAGVDGSVEEQQTISRKRDATTTKRLFGTLGALLPLDIFGRTRREVEAMRAGLEFAEADFQSIVLDVSSGIVSEYLRLRGNQRQLELLRESVDLQEKTLFIVRSRYEAGLSPELDLRRAETSVENLRADIAPLEESLLNSRNRLAVLTGRFPGAYEKLLKEQKRIPDYQNRIPGRVPFEVLQMLPDIRQAEAALKQAIAFIGVSKAEYYPAFELRGAVGIGTTGVSSASATDVLISSLGALIEQRIADGGVRKANINIARSRAQQALADYEHALRGAIEDVEASLVAIRASLERQTSLNRAVESSKRSFYQAEILYQQGLISFLDVVDAQRVLASAEQKLAAERTNYATQIAILFRALGT